jgi:hypothetical protein
VRVTPDETPPLRQAKARKAATLRGQECKTICRRGQTREAHPERRTKVRADHSDDGIQPVSERRKLNLLVVPQIRRSIESEGPDGTGNVSTTIDGFPHRVKRKIVDMTEISEKCKGREKWPALYGTSPKEVPHQFSRHSENRNRPRALDMDSGIFSKKSENSERVPMRNDPAGLSRQSAGS